MKIISREKPIMRIGLRENYETTIAYYRCGHLLCPGSRDPLIRAPNGYCADFDEYDYEVKAKVCELRWTQRLTHEEIVHDMDRLYGIKINHSAIEITLKMYELGCAEKYRLDYFRRIHARGGVLLQVDAMKPLKGKNALYAAHDYYTGLSLSSKHLDREGQAEIGAFLGNLKNYLTTLGIAILGVISDAHTGQLMAIETVFGPEIPHSLCHFHFFKLILKKPKELDSQLSTTLRKNLRGMYYIQEYRKNFKGSYATSKETPFVEHILHDLYTLSNWNQKKRDPAFSGLAYYQRIQEITVVLDEFVSDLDKHLVNLEPQDEKRIRKLTLKLKALLEIVQEGFIELQRIKVHLQELSQILEETEETAQEGLNRLSKVTAALNRQRKSKSCGPIEQEFITQLVKFVKTKGPKLFNYRLIPDAPRTNNGQELAFKQIKHLLRRTIGYSTAGTYLLAHGERMLFVNPKESFQKIVEILKRMDWTADRKKIQAERIRKNATVHSMHDPKRWMNELNRLGEKWAFLKK